MSLFHFPTAASPASQEDDMTLTSKAPKDPSVMKTGNNESHLKEPSPTGGESSSSHDEAEGKVIRPYLGHIV